jgi:hypothetical protein
MQSMQSQSETEPVSQAAGTPVVAATQRLVATVGERVALGAFVLVEVYFLVFFDPGRWQPTVDLAWAVAVGAWLAIFWRPEPTRVPRLPQPYWFYALYVGLLLPFCTNWRFVLSGDNLSYPTYGLAAAQFGPAKSLLSTDGADQFGHLQTTLHNLFMLLIEPTLFWHRVGKITVAVLALAAIYSVFARLVAPRFGLLVAACSATCSVWIVYTYASVPFMDGIASGYALLAVGLWVHRSPASRTAWLMLGLLSGFMLFLTPNGWLMAIFVWGWLTPQVFWRRWPLSNFVLALATGLVTGLPTLLQWSHGNEGELFTLVEHPGWTVDKVFRFLREAALLPFASQVQECGAFGPQLPWGFRWLFVPGILLTPLFGRRFPGARFVFCIYALHVVALAFTQGPYGGVSVKRALIIIPMATYFVFLPFHRSLRSLPVVLVLIAAWASFGIYDLVARIQPGRTGYNLIDGVVEAHQRFSDAPVCVYLRSRDRAASFAPGSVIDRLYRLSPHLQAVSEPNDPRCRDVLCYCPKEDEEHLPGSVDLKTMGYVEVPMLNTVELRCGRQRLASGG